MLLETVRIEDQFAIVVLLKEVPLLLIAKVVVETEVWSEKNLVSQNYYQSALLPMWSPIIQFYQIHYFHLFMWKVLLETRKRYQIFPESNEVLFSIFVRVDCYFSFAKTTWLTVFYYLTSLFNLKKRLYFIQYRFFSDHRDLNCESLGVYASHVCVQLFPW